MLTIPKETISSVNKLVSCEFLRCNPEAGRIVRWCQVV